MRLSANLSVGHPTDIGRRPSLQPAQIEHNCLLSASIVEEIGLDGVLDLFARQPAASNICER